MSNNRAKKGTAHFVRSVSKKLLSSSSQYRSDDDAIFSPISTADAHPKSLSWFRARSTSAWGRLISHYQTLLFMKNKIGKFIFLFILVILISFLFVYTFFLNKDLIFFNSLPIEKTTANIDFENKKTELKIFAVGDIMLGRGVSLMVKRYGDGNFKFPFLRIADFLKEADILFANLEGPISNKGRRVGSIYSFRFSPESVEGLKYAGFDIVNLANNHMFDYTVTALRDTLFYLRKAGIEYIGAGANKKEAFSAKIIEKKGIKIGFLGFVSLGPKSWLAGDNKPGLAWMDKNGNWRLIVSSLIKRLKEKADIVIVSLHGGVEYAYQPSSFKIKFAEECINDGADMVLMHHPHVVQKLVKYKNGWVAYSLGNFIFDQGFSKRTMEGAVLIIKVKGKKVDRAEYKIVKLNKFFQPIYSSRE